MRQTLISELTHSHQFAAHNDRGEKRTRYVLALTLVTMIAEISAGSLFGSMALLADGWHMGTHAAAFCITLFAYRYAKNNENSGKFSFGAGKVSVLGGYSSAVALGLVALIMCVESVDRLLHPQTILFNEAISVAIIGLIVNLVSMLLLHDDHHHHHHHHEHEHEHEHEDHNLKAAYVHVLADALTSLLAIIALFVGKYAGWIWLDAIMGMVGALVIAKWSYNLMQQTSPILLDASISQTYQQAIIELLEQDNDKVTDLHIWPISADHYAAEITLLTDSQTSVKQYKQKLQQFDRINHLTIEVHHG